MSSARNTVFTRKALFIRQKQTLATRLRIPELSSEIVFGLHCITAAAFVFWESMDKVHVWIALHQDEKQEKIKEKAEVRKLRAELLQQQKEQDSLG